MPRILVLVLAIAAAIPAAAQSPAARDTSEHAAVRRAVLDYVEGFYEGDTAKLVRAFRPDFFKYGYSRHRDSTTYRGSQMRWEDAMGYANRVRARNQPTPAGAPKQVELFDVQDQTASAKLTAWWGTDYLLLAKENGQWKITHVLWQSAPPRRR